MGKIHKALEKSKNERADKKKEDFFNTGRLRASNDHDLISNRNDRAPIRTAPEQNPQKLDLGEIHKILDDSKDGEARNVIADQGDFQTKIEETGLKNKTSHPSLPETGPRRHAAPKYTEEFEPVRSNGGERAFGGQEDPGQPSLVFSAAPSVVPGSPPSEVIGKEKPLKIRDRSARQGKAASADGEDSFKHTDSDLSPHYNVDNLLVALLKPRSYEAEQFKILRTNLLFPESGKAARSILVTSASPGDGKSFVAANLAVSLALKHDRKVLLIDADVRRAEIHRIFGLYRVDKGVYDYLNGQMPLSSLLVDTSLNNLVILPAGKLVRNSSELQSLEKLPKLIEELALHFSEYFIVIDSPPPKLASETGVLARLVDSIIIIVKSGVTKREYVEETVDLLEKDKIAGIVFNWHDDGISSYKKYAKNREYYL